VGVRGEQQHRPLVKDVDYLQVNQFPVEFDLPDRAAVALDQECIVFLNLDQETLVGHCQHWFLLQALEAG